MTQDQINKICALFCGLEYQEGWWCEKCQSFVDGRQVTYQENHETCGYPVIYKMVDFSPRSPDWWTLWDRVTGDKEFYKQLYIKYGFQSIVGTIDFVNNLHENVCDYLRYALDNGLHQELFKGKCPKHDSYEIVECYYQHDCEMECAGTGTIDTPLARAVKEVKE